VTKAKQGTGTPGSQLARQRWKDTTEDERAEVARTLNEAKWEKWRAANPERAAELDEKKKARAARAAARVAKKAAAKKATKGKK